MKAQDESWSEPVGEKENIGAAKKEIDNGRTSDNDLNRLDAATGGTMQYATGSKFMIKMLHEFNNLSRKRLDM